ncbi:MAG TPA: asparagine synthetase B [Thermodesulfobacteriota bacterium]|nr:asparagine synthetase B [Thermodesulfobacteriota bacterium]HOC38643.1 asparagine synthetase B [Thermodesulfobacteriota bacterium]
MCGIAGVVSKHTHINAVPLLKHMLYAMTHRGPDGAGIAAAGVVQRKRTLRDICFEELQGPMALGHVRLAVTGGVDGMQPFTGKNLVLLHNGEIYNHHELRNEFGPTLHCETDTDSEVILGLLEHFYDGDLYRTVSRLLPLLDGVYVLAVTDNKQTVLARDKIGVRQLYYSSNENHLAFASEKKPLLALGIPHDGIARLQPGHLMVISGNDTHISEFWNPYELRSSEYITDPDEALDAYRRVLTKSIRKRINGQKRVGIVFSGGIDSMLIAHMLQSENFPFTCYTAGSAGATDIEWAARLAQAYGFPLKIKTLSVEDIEALIPRIIEDIEDYSLNQVEVAVPLHAAMTMAQENGERVVLTGQGADELFGGYSWYPRIVDQEGYASFERYSWDDTFLLYKECLEREDKIAMAHSIELRVPYLDPEVIEIAFRISPALKISEHDDQFGKRLHRDLALFLGIPREIAYRKKEAAQHGANIHTILDSLARTAGITDDSLVSAGYHPDQFILEKLGSSSRYGFRYGDHHLWKPLSHVQYYLDSRAAQLNLFPLPAKTRWKQISAALKAT